MVEQVDQDAGNEHVTIEDIWAAAPIARLFARHRTEATAALEERVKLLEAALRNMLEHYLGIAHSGDAGFWDPETEPEVISAREALNDPR